MKPKFRIVWYDKLDTGFYLRCMNQAAEDLITKSENSVWYATDKPYRE